MGELALGRDFGFIKAGEMLAFPGSVSERSAKRISGSAEELIRNISGMMEDLVLSVIEKRTAAEFEAIRDKVFPKYCDAVLALASLIPILVPQQVIDRLNREFFCELEADLKDRGLTAFGAAVRDQALFTVWTLRKISDYMSQIASVQASLDKDKQRDAAELGRDCIFHAIRTRFHVHCLISSMQSGTSIHPDVIGLMMDGLRSVVNAFGLARRLLDLVVPLPVVDISPVEWDDEDRELLAEATRDTLPELA
jgi:hypothetical protein